VIVEVFIEVFIDGETPSIKTYEYHITSRFLASRKTYEYRITIPTRYARGYIMFFLVGIRGGFVKHPIERLGDLASPLQVFYSDITK